MPSRPTHLVAGNQFQAANPISNDFQAALAETNRGLAHPSKFALPAEDTAAEPDSEAAQQHSLIRELRRAQMSDSAHLRGSTKGQVALARLATSDPAKDQEYQWRRQGHARNGIDLTYADHVHDLFDRHFGIEPKHYAEYAESRQAK